MKVLIVCSGNAENFDFKLHHAFVYEQIESIKNIYKIEYETYFIKGKWFTGYLKNLRGINKKIKSISPDIVHGHFGLSGLLACMQRKLPVVITFHGSDANIFKVQLLSILASKLSHFNIFVSDRIKNKINVNERNSVVPCGVNLDSFYEIDMKIARSQLGLIPEKNYLLFSSDFDNPIKNYPLAASAIKKVKADSELLELKNRTRAEVNLLLNASNLLLLTSISEGSPQIIKEAMACNCPIVATDVGDIKEVIGETEGCYITSSDPSDIAEKISLALQFNQRTDGREKIKKFDNNIIAEKIFNIYQEVINN